MALAAAGLADLVVDQVVRVGSAGVVLADPVAEAARHNRVKSYPHSFKRCFS